MRFYVGNLAKLPSLSLRKLLALLLQLQESVNFLLAFWSTFLYFDDKCLFRTAFFFLGIGYGVNCSIFALVQVAAYSVPVTEKLALHSVEEDLRVVRVFSGLATSFAIILSILYTTIGQYFDVFHFNLVACKEIVIKMLYRELIIKILE